METNNSILKELTEISPLVAEISRRNVYSVPTDYFATLPAEILLKVDAEPSMAPTKENPFAVPGGYFESLAGNILNKIRSQQVQSVAEELNELAPILNTISKKTVYAVPEGYFESLEITIPMKVTRPGAKVFGIGKIKRVVQYAVAACTAGILMIGAYMYINSDDAGDMVISHDSAMNMNVTEELSAVNEQEITAYLDEVPGVGYTVNVTEDINVDEFLQTASDEEIRQYLNETATPGETIITGS